MARTAPAHETEHDADGYRTGDIGPDVTAPTDAELLAALDRGIALGDFVVVDAAYLPAEPNPLDEECGGCLALPGEECGPGCLSYVL